MVPKDTKQALQRLRSRVSLTSESDPRSAMPRGGILGWLCLAWVTGTWIGVHVAPPWPTVLMILSGVTCLTMISVSRGRWTRGVMVESVTVLAVASSWSSLVTGSTSDHQARLLEICDGRIVTVRGRIVETSEHDERRIGLLERHGRSSEGRSILLGDVVLDGEIDHGVDVIGKMNARVRGSGIDALAFSAGDVVEIKGRLRSTRAPSNPCDGGIRTRSAWIDVPTSSLIRCVGRSNPSTWTMLAGWIGTWKSIVNEKMDEILSWPSSGNGRELVNAMVLGRRGDGYERLSEPYKRTGTAHYLAVSGFAFGVMAGIQVLATSGFSSGVRMITLCVTTLVALFSIDARTPAIRAGLIIMITSIGMSCFREWSRSSILGFSAVVILLFNPMEVTNAGFQLSFTVVASLMFLSSDFEKRLPGSRFTDDGRIRSILVTILRKSTACGVVAWSVSTPILLHHFGTISTTGWLCSIVVAPMVVCSVTSSILGLFMSFIFEPIGITFGMPAVYMACAIDVMISLAASVPGTYLTVGRPSFIWMVFAVSIVFGWFRCRSRTSTSILTASSILATLWFVTGSSIAVPAGESRLVTLDVGNGTCHLFQSQDCAVMVDCGSMSTMMLGTGTVLPTMEHLGIRHLDAIYLTHPNLDHFSGMGEIVGRIPIGMVCVGESFMEKSISAVDGPERELIELLERWSIETRVICSGEIMRTHQHEWSIIHPPAGYRGVTENDSSLVIRVDRSDAKIRDRCMILFTGDIEEAGMHDVLERDHRLVRTHVLEAPHHGSVRKSTPGFVEKADPDIIIQSTGERRMIEDHFGRLITNRTRYVTAHAGAVETIFVGGIPVRVITHKRW